MHCPYCATAQSDLCLCWARAAISDFLESSASIIVVSRGRAYR